MPTDLRKVLGENLNFFLRHYKARRCKPCIVSFTDSY